MLIIGELINATRKKVREAIVNKDEVYLQELARKQEEAGAHYIDVNTATGRGLEQEIEDMKWVISALREVVEKPLVIDTSERVVLEAGLKAHGNGAMINSVSAEKGRLEPFLELALQYDSPVIVLPIGEAGIPKDLPARMEVASLIMEAVHRAGVSPGKLYFDPLAMPLSVNSQSGLLALELISAFKEKFGVNTTIGLTNISHGMPRRGLLNRTFLALALLAGLDSAIMDPLDKGVMSSYYAAKAALGQDDYCSSYLKAYRRGLFE